MAPSPQEDDDHVKLTKEAASDIAEVIPTAAWKIMRANSEEMDNFQKFQESLQEKDDIAEEIYNYDEKEREHKRLLTEYELLKNALESQGNLSSVTRISSQGNTTIMSLKE